MEITRIKTTKYNWWNNDIDKISSDQHDDLDKAALERINEMEKDGFTSGELHEIIDINEKEIEFQGWWTISISTE